jgi:hypothetical protein
MGRRRIRRRRRRRKGVKFLDQLSDSWILKE